MSEFLFSLEPDENVAILTVNGKMLRGVVRHPQDLWQNADTITEMMIFVMKKEDSRKGIWYWKIRKNWSEILGYACEVR